MKILLINIAVFFCLHASAQVYIAPSTHFVVVGNTQVTMQDVGLLSEGVVHAGNSTFRFSGTTDVNIGGSAPMLLNDFHLNKTSSAIVSILQDLSVSNQVIFEGGLLNLGVRNLDLGTTGSLVNESEVSRIYSTESGEVLARRTLNAPQQENPGALGAFITSSMNMGEVTIKRGHLSQTNGNGQGNSILRYYEIIPANNNDLSATLRLQYFDAELNSIQESSLIMWSSPGNNAWTNRGYTTRNLLSNFVELESIPEMMRFTLSSAASPLPVTGLHLTGRWENDRSELSWLTLTEYNNSHFNIQRRYSDQSYFTGVGRMNSSNIGGNSQTSTNYYYIDLAASNRGVIFYRLEQADLDGMVSYSNTISVNPGGVERFINYVAANVAINNTIQIAAGDMNLETMTVMVYDAAGRIYMHKQIAYLNQQIHMPQMARGVYYVKIRSGHHQFVTSFIK